MSTATPPRPLLLTPTSFSARIWFHLRPVLFTAVVTGTVFAVPYLREHVGETTVAVCGAMVLVRLLLDGHASYRAYLALGPGGVPHNVLGWGAQGLLTPLAARAEDTRQSEIFSLEVQRDGQRRGRGYGELGSRRFIKEMKTQEPARGGPLPSRLGPRPEIAPFIAPQRQVTGLASADVVLRMSAHLEHLVSLHPSHLALRPSGLEGTDACAVFLAQTLAVPRLLA